MKKISRIWLSITALAITGLTLSGCTAGGAGDSSRPVIGISVKTITNDPFQQAWVDAATASGQTAVANQVSQINDLIARRVNALIVNPIDGQAIVPALQRAQSGHIPVIVVDSAVADGNENLYESFIATDNVLAGEQAAKFLTKSLHPTAKVAIVEGAAGSL